MVVATPALIIKEKLAQLTINAKYKKPVLQVFAKEEYLRTAMIQIYVQTIPATLPKAVYILTILTLVMTRTSALKKIPA
jgi:hypothetical protein